MLDSDNETLNSMTSNESSGNFSRLSLSDHSPERLYLKPHRSSDSSWQVIQRRKATLGIKGLRLVRQVGSGDIGRVFMCRLHGGGDEAVFAMKVVDNEVAAKKKKIERVEMERKILKMMDHPFLPTLYAEFKALRFSCVVMEYCSGGDLHSLRHKQPHKRFSLSAARYILA